jgi:integrase/recombinase XerD
MAPRVAWLRRPAGNVLLLPGTPPARAASTVNRALSAVMSFYDFHRLQGVELADLMLDPRRGGRGAFRPFLAGIARDSARGRRGRMPVARRAPRVLSLEQVARVVAGQSRLRDRLLFVLLFTTGMRIGQALGLRHEDVRVWKRELAIVPREDNANGARGKRGHGVVPLTEEAARLYLLYMEHEYGLLDSDYVFVNRWGGERGRPLNYAAVSRLVVRTRRRVGFDFAPHDFRHTFVTLARRGGVRLEVISRVVTIARSRPRQTSTATWSSRISARSSTRRVCLTRLRTWSGEPRAAGARRGAGARGGALAGGVGGPHSARVPGRSVSSAARAPGALRAALLGRRL